MFRTLDNLIKRGVDWLYEHTLGITSPSKAAQVSPEERESIRKALAQGYVGRPLNFVDPPLKTGEESLKRGEPAPGRQDNSIPGHHTGSERNVDRLD